MLQSAFQALQSGNPAYAEQISRQLLRNRPNDEGGLLLLALALDAMSRRNEANTTFERLTELYPDRAGHWLNLGNMRRTLGFQSGARTAYEHALALEPEQADALQGLGLIEFDNGLFHEARRHLLQALQYAPDNVELRAQAAKACHETGDLEQVQALLQGWEQWSAADAIVMADIAWIHTEINDMSAAERALDMAERRDPGNLRVLARRAAFLERTNRVAEAQSVLSRIPRDDAGAAGVNEEVDIVRALLAARVDDSAEACRLHELLLADPAAGMRHPHLYFSLARLYDRRGDAAQAMHWLQRGHEHQIAQLAHAAPELLAPETDPVYAARQRISADDYARWDRSDAPSAAESPIFVLGFPRSGTTVLETMLDAHPDLSCMDERSFLHDLTKTMNARGLRYPEDLAQLDTATLTALREQYWRQVYGQTQAQRGKRLIDKNPLNMLRLPLIARLFPHAKIVLALRDPRDVVLSNYMQMFRAPGYVAMCATLESTARGYDRAFAFWQHHAELFQPDLLSVRHEDLVEDAQAHARRLCEFLQIDWAERMVAFHEHAAERGYIRTPSYHQVVEPMNRKGVGRWQRYQSWLEPCSAALDAHLQRYGYAAS